MCLFEKGEEMSSPERGVFQCRAFLLAGTADLPARSLLCNSVQYNGAFGCWKCTQEGKSAHIGRGYCHVFPFIHDNPNGPKRQSEDVIKDAKEIVALKKQGKKQLSVNGVKGPSWLLLFPNFCIIRGIAIDYMHGVLLGVQKLMLRLWFLNDFKGKDFSFHRCVFRFDQLLQSIQPTSQITRLPRSIIDLKYWKASEFRSFLLYYGAPVLVNILDGPRFQHYLKLVQALYLLLKCGSSKNDVNKADQLLRIFCEQFSTLYDECYMTLNVHQLLHLADSVRDLGPLYTHSCFSFEDKNGFVLKTIRGTQNIDSQIVTGISFVQKLPELKDKCIVYGSFEESICAAIENPNVLKRRDQLSENVYILGAVTNKKLGEIDFDALVAFQHAVPYSVSFPSFNRLEFQEQLIYGAEYSRMIKRDNSAIVFRNNENKIEFGRVRFFCQISNGDECQVVAFVNELNCSTYSENSSILRVTKVLNKVKVVPLYNIESSCMFTDLSDKGGKCFVCLYPNRLESD